MEAKYKRFLEYDFEKSKGWKQFLKHLPLNPAKEQIPLFKRKWYKDNIDREFNVDYTPPPPPPPNSFEYKPNPTCQGTPNLLGLTEVILFLMIIPAGTANIGLYFAIAAFFCGLVANTGVPRMNAEYWTLVTFSDDLHSLVFCSMFLMYSSSMWFLPVIIGAASRICEILYSFKGTPASLKGLIKPMFDQKFEMDFMKAQVEVGMGAATAFIAVTGTQGLIFTFAYINFLRMKHMVNKHTTTAFASIRIVGDSSFTAWPFKPIWEKVKWVGNAFRIEKS